MKNFVPTEQSDKNITTWLSMIPYERTACLKKWIEQQQDPSSFSFWIEKSPPIEQQTLKDVPQSLMRNAPYGYQSIEKFLTSDYLISLEKMGFDVFKKMNSYQISQLVEKFYRTQNLDILKMSLAATGEFHLRVLHAVCSHPIQKERFKTLWNALDWEWMVKTNGNGVILALSKLGEKSYGKKWSDFVQIVSQTHNGKTLVKRAINFPGKDDWIDKMYLCAAGLELWGGECVVPSRKPILSQSFKDAMSKIQDSHIHKPPAGLVEFVESFLLRDYLISEVSHKDHAQPSRRKI